MGVLRWPFTPAPLPLPRYLRLTFQETHPRCTTSVAACLSLTLFHHFPVLPGLQIQDRPLHPFCVVAGILSREYSLLRIADIFRQQHDESVGLVPRGEKLILPVSAQGARGPLS